MRTALWLFIILILAVLLRLFPMQEFHTGDETAYLQHAERMVSGKANYDELAIRPPLLPVLFAGGFLLWHSPYMASIIVALLSTSLCLAAFLIAKRLHSEHAGLFAALLAAVHPLFVQYSRLLLTDALVAALLGFALAVALRDKWDAGIWTGMFAALAGLMKFTGLGAAPLLLAWLTYSDYNAKPRFFRFERAAGFIIAFALTVLPYALWAGDRFGNPLKVLSKAQAIVNAVNGSPMTYLSIALFTIPLLIGLCLCAAYRKSCKPIVRNYAILSIVWLVSIIGYLLTFPNKEVRFATAAVVPLFALAGVGYAAMIPRRKRLRKYYMVLGVTAILLFSFGSFTAWTQAPINHWKDPAVDLSLQIAAIGNSSLPIYATGDYPIYGYYTQNQVVVVDGTGFRKAYPRIMPRDGYLTIYKESLREPTEGWADSQRELSRVAENDKIILYRYTKAQ